MQKYLGAVTVWAFLFILPIAVSAADLVTCGGPNDQPCNSCDAVTLTNNVLAWLVAILGVIAAILIVVAGARLVTSGGNASAMEQAKSSMTNLIVGYIIVLSAWLVLDYGLKALLVQDGTYSFGVWNQVSCITENETNFKDVKQEQVVYLPIEEVLQSVTGWAPVSSTGGNSGSGFTSGSIAFCTSIPRPSGTPGYDCAPQMSQCRSAGGNPTVTTQGDRVVCSTPVGGGGGGSTGTGGSLPQCNNSYCSVSALMRAGMTNTQANVMSCIAMTESSGNPSIGPYNERNPGSNSSACGLFQIVRTTWNRYNPGGACSDHGASCRNATCNTKVAVNLVRSNGFSDWTCANCNSKAIQCIRRYGSN